MEEMTKPSLLRPLPRARETQPLSSEWSVWGNVTQPAPANGAGRCPGLQGMSYYSPFLLAPDACFCFPADETTGLGNG